MQLYIHQQKLLDENPQKHLLCWDTGVGKSLTFLELCVKNATGFLLIGTKTIAGKWDRDVRSHRASGLPYVIMTKEEFRRDWDTLPYFGTVGVDEAHYFATASSQMSKALEGYLKKWNPERVYLMTATPYLSSAWNIFQLAKYVGQPMNWKAFSMEFFHRVKMGRRTIPRQKDGIEGKIAQLVNALGSTVRIDECADIPEQVFEFEYFGLSSTQKRAIDEQVANEPNPVVRYGRIHQIENGSLKGDQYVPDRKFEHDKLMRVIELAGSNRKLAVVCKYNAQVDMYREYLEKEGKRVYVINGDVPAKDRTEAIARAEADDDCVIVINAYCSEGYELPSFGVIVFASHSWSYKDRKQMLGRFLRLNRLKRNVYIDLIVEGGVDESVFGAITRKEDFSIEIYSHKFRNQ